MTKGFRDVPLLFEMYDRFGSEEMCLFLFNYMKNDGGIVSRAVDILRRVQKRWGEEPYIFLVGYLGGGEFPKIEFENEMKQELTRDEYGRWIVEH